MDDSTTSTVASSPLLRIFPSLLYRRPSILSPSLLQFLLPPSLKCTARIDPLRACLSFTLVLGQSRHRQPTHRTSYIEVSGIGSLRQHHPSIVAARDATLTPDQLLPLAPGHESWNSRNNPSALFEFERSPDFHGSLHIINHNNSEPNKSTTPGHSLPAYLEKSFPVSVESPEFPPKRIHPFGGWP